MKARLSIGTIWGNAADCLKRYYWKGFGVALLLTFIAGIINYVVGSIETGILSLLGLEDFLVSSHQIGDYLQMPVVEEAYLSVPDWRALIISEVMSFLAGIFIQWVFSTGPRWYFLKARCSPDKVTLSDVFAPFKKYCKAIGYAFADKWRITLPGIVATPVIIVGIYLLSDKRTQIIAIVLLAVSAISVFIAQTIISLQLFCLKYIFVSNPGISAKRAVEISSIMTEGYKGKMFWNSILTGGLLTLGFCCCGIGWIFVSPYVSAIDAEMYTFLYEVAKENGRIDSNEITTLVEYKESEIIES